MPGSAVINWNIMIRKEETFRLGQEVLFGEKREHAFVDALTRSSVGLVLWDGRYVIASWDDVWEA